MQVGERDGTRAGERDGTRAGERDGTRAGERADGTWAGERVDSTLNIDPAIDCEDAKPPESIDLSVESQCKMAVARKSSDKTPTEIKRCKKQAQYDSSNLDIICECCHPANTSTDKKHGTDLNGKPEKNVSTPMALTQSLEKHIENTSGIMLASAKLANDVASAETDELSATGNVGETEKEKEKMYFMENPLKNHEAAERVQRLDPELQV
ncbi:hypothetical protein PoB_004604500 [Plakobranchus ocellatus]|uniref:Uncharacterized protein n=1 Tax=Plakobranchus ocellatus TaxID=259542 RepID=A0AAV4BG59_9GAST|nr:hypothetical protein PoB_004604500 [Plakobranchus ocellatus]